MQLQCHGLDALSDAALSGARNLLKYKNENEEFGKVSRQVLYFILFFIFFAGVTIVCRLEINRSLYSRTKEHLKKTADQLFMSKVDLSSPGNRSALLHNI